MRYSFALRLVMASALVMAAAPAARAADTVEGEILDMACWIGRSAKGPSHTRCAQTCAEHGMPLGILSKSDSKVYLLYPKHGAEEAFEDVKKLAGVNAKLTGKLQEKDGLFGMEVHSAAKAD
ncbi:MAG TPA: hypothetical protein VEC57_07825 [Candidatus Limnocylindrales bacterium]|nr:hypothetical protein [Candidatus Limnocylindrales bacterium]